MARPVEDELGISDYAARLRGGGLIPLPPKGTMTGAPVPGGAGASGGTPSGPATPDKTKTKTPTKNLLKLPKGDAKGASSASGGSAYDKYLAKQTADANAAKRKSGNRYVDQAETLGLQARALRALLGLKLGPLTTGGKVGERKDKGGKGGFTIGHGWGQWNSETDGNAGDMPEKDPRSRIKGPFGLTAEPREPRERPDQLKGRSLPGQGRRRG
jgi:hypothetical protein